jgi:hypothetical protein
LYRHLPRTLRLKARTRCVSLTHDFHVFRAFVEKLWDQRLKTLRTLRDRRRSAFHLFHAFSRDRLIHSFRAQCSDNHSSRRVSANRRSARALFSLSLTILLNLVLNSPSKPRAHLGTAIQVLPPRDERVACQHPRAYPQILPTELSRSQEQESEG